ncbi:MAG: LnmK family bifunctional acyltransferase/decarboxylase [bacterium]
MINKSFEFTLGLQHTNYQGAAEHLMMAQIGSCEWDTIAGAVGLPLNNLRTKNNQEVYASFFFISCEYQDDSLLRKWKLDEKVRVRVVAASYKNLMLNAQVVIQGQGSKSAQYQMCNLFITPGQSNAQLKIAPPCNGDFTSLATLNGDDPIISIRKKFAETNVLGLFDTKKKAAAQSEHRIVLSIERDTNGAGLVYFANYFYYLNESLRSHLNIKINQSLPSPIKRKLIFLKNVDPDDTLKITTRDYGDGKILQEIYRIRDNERICYSESLIERT